MIFSLAIYSSPTSATSYSAYRFACSLLQQNHQLYRVFFYYEGVHHGSALTCSTEDEIDLSDQWQALQQKHQLDIVVCIAAGLRRGVIDPVEAERHQKLNANLSARMVLSGLGQLVDAAALSDRLITFGG